MKNGFRGIYIQEIDGKTFNFIGEQKKIYDGSGIGCTEGPHLYHIKDWYYLLVAEGGTGYDHCVTIARSKKIYGPYETSPNTPLLTSNQKDCESLQKCGHGDLVNTDKEEWYLVHLCSRPLKDSNWCVLGRETGIQKIEWTEDEWPILVNGDSYAQLCVPEPYGNKENVNQFMKANEFQDTFMGSSISCQYVSPRTSYKSFATLSQRKGYLRIYGQESMNSLHHVSLLAVKQEEIHAQVETCFEFKPEYEEQLAGLAYLYDAYHFYLLAKTVDATGQEVICLLQSIKGNVIDLMTPIPLKGEQLSCKIVVSMDGKQIYFYYKEVEDWKKIDVYATTEILTDEYCRGFTGAHFGMYVHDMTGARKYADFNSFSIRYE